MTRHRAKCRLCSGFLEAKAGDYLTCACGEISLDATSSLTKYIAREWDNLIRIDEEGNEIKFSIQDRAARFEERSQDQDDISSAKQDPEGDNPYLANPYYMVCHETTHDAIIRLIETVEGLPPIAMNTAITHYDYLSLLYLLRSITSKGKHGPITECKGN